MHILENGGTIAEAKFLFQYTLVLYTEWIQFQKTERLTSAHNFIVHVNKFLWNQKLITEKENNLHSGGLNIFFTPEVIIDHVPIVEPDNYNEITEAIKMEDDHNIRLLECYFYKFQDMGKAASSLGYADSVSLKEQVYICLERISKRICSKGNTSSARRFSFFNSEVCFPRFVRQ